MHGMLHALRDDEVDVVIAHNMGGEWAQIPPNARVHMRTSWRWRAPSRLAGRIALNPIRRGISKPYDVAIMQRWAQDVLSTSRSRIRLVIPSGNPLRGFRAPFDFVAMQAPDNVKFVDPGTPTLLLPPPLLPLATSSVAPNVGLPAEFFLTVFNPYGAVKGANDLLKAADEAPLPIVWCHSRRTLSFSVGEELLHHRNIIHVDDPSPSELRYLYETCKAYLSFSVSEGFGWAIADALRYSPAVVSRRVGILSFPEAGQEGVHLLAQGWRFDWEILNKETVKPRRNLDFVSAEKFREKLLEGLARAE